MKTKPQFTFKSVKSMKSTSTTTNMETPTKL
jgi:hypothetical protein